MGLIVMDNIELTDLDLKYKYLRMKNHQQEGALLASIAARGIEEPLEGVDAEGVHLLLNGFKRYRCSCKLSIKTVPYTSIGQDEVVAIVALLRNSQAKSLNILEQAGFFSGVLIYVYFAPVYAHKRRYQA